MSELDSKMKITCAAKKLFAKKGFEGTSTREIVAEAGVNISLIAYHYGSKEKLFFTLFDHFLENTYEEINSNEDYSIDEFKEIITSIIRLRFDEPDLVTILQQELTLYSSRSEKLREILAPFWDRLRGILDYQMQQGVFQIKDVDNALSFVMAIAAFPRQHTLYQSYIKKTQVPECVVDEAVTFILRGLGYLKTL